MACHPSARPRETAPTHTRTVDVSENKIHSPGSRHRMGEDASTSGYKLLYEALSFCAHECSVVMAVSMFPRVHGHSEMEVGLPTSQ